MYASFQMIIKLIWVSLKDSSEDLFSIKKFEMYTYQKMITAAAAAAAKSLQSCPTLCDPRDGSLPGSSVPGILQARTPEWVAISFSNAWEWKVKVNLLSRLWLRDTMDCSPPGSSIHGIFQARILEWGAIAFSITIWATREIQTTL